MKIPGNCFRLHGCRKCHRMHEERNGAGCAVLSCYSAATASKTFFSVRTAASRLTGCRGWRRLEHFTHWCSRRWCSGTAAVRWPRLRAHRESSLFYGNLRFAPPRRLSQQQSPNSLCDYAIKCCSHRPACAHSMPLHCGAQGRRRSGDCPAGYMPSTISCMVPITLSIS